MGFWFCGFEGGVMGLSTEWVKLGESPLKVWLFNVI